MRKNDLFWFFFFSRTVIQIFVILLHKIFLRSSNILSSKCVWRSSGWFSHSHHWILRRRCSTFCRRVRDNPWVIYEESLRNRCANLKLKSFDMFNFRCDRLDVIENCMKWRRFSGNFSRCSRRCHFIMILKWIFVFIYFKVRINLRECRIVKFYFFLFRTMNWRSSKYFKK